MLCTCATYDMFRGVLHHKVHYTTAKQAKALESQARLTLVRSQLADVDLLQVEANHNGTWM
jgi:hypothetical protein